MECIMSKKLFLTIGASALLALTTSDLFAGGCSNCGKCKKKTTEEANKQEKQQTICPVMGGKIDKNQYTDVKGKRIYVCCKGCINTINADPDKYIKKLEDSGVTLEKAPEKK